MYTITFPIPIVSSDNKRVILPVGLARDILTQLKYQPQLRLICPSASDSKSIPDPWEIDLEKYPGLSFRFLPWNGGSRSWSVKFLSIRKALIEEAANASVWHTTCSLNLWDLTTVSYYVGHRYAKGLRVLCLDSDPAAMLENSNGWAARKAGLIRSRYKSWVAEVDATIFVGSGVEQIYGQCAQRSVLTGAVWLQNGDLANPKQTKLKFDQAVSDPVKLCLPSRLTAWKGVDNVIEALMRLSSQLPKWQLDIIGDGPEKASLSALARDCKERIRFLDPVPYGSEFFELLQSYHVVFAPTRGQEETRIIYDAAASGCVLIHSRTVTLESALTGLKPRWNFEPGNIESLSHTLISAFSERDRWLEAGLSGIAFMRGRTIDEMHRIRAEFLNSLREN